MGNKSYQETIDWLFQQFPSYQAIGAAAYKPDLGNIIHLLDELGNPEKELRFIHIAGSNGKGSTSSLLASILKESGEKVGLFTSPHIQDFRERIRVNGEMISEQSVIDFCRPFQTEQLSIEPSFFEITFAMALEHFKKEACTICVIETGLGGRLDATNCITPLLSVITNISLEHTQFLGNTHEEIAFEKAGIIKPFVPVIIGETSHETKDVFTKQAELKNSPIYWAEKFISGETVDFPLLGSYQRNNFKTVLCALEILKQKGFSITHTTIQLGLNHLSENTGFYGRMQLISKEPNLILDVSHNVDGIQKTLESIQHINQGKLHIIYGTSSDKNYQEIVDLFPNDAQLYFSTFTNLRSISIEQIEELIEKKQLDAKLFSNVREAINVAQLTANKEDTILVFGSFFLISDFF
jgi:dihydrofolate synthase/folylpolyglutamate synthase